MNIEKMRRQAEEVEVVRTMATLAKKELETAFADLNAVSEQQREYALDVRISALANLWRGIDPAFQTTTFADAIIRATNRHTNAKWWIECEKKFSLAHKGTFSELDNDIEEEMR